MSSLKSGWSALSELPAPYRDALRTGTLPTEPGWVIYGARSTSWLEAASLLFTVPFGLFAVGVPASLLWRLMNEPALQERMFGYMEKGQWFAVGLGIVLPIGLALIGGALLVSSWASVDIQRHQYRNRRGTKQGQRYYGLLLGPDRLVWRSPESPKLALSIARGDLAAVRTHQRLQEHRPLGSNNVINLLELTWSEGKTEARALIPFVDVVGVNPIEVIQHWWGGVP